MTISRWLFTRRSVQRFLRPLLERAIEKYDYQRGGDEAVPTFFSRDLFKWGSWTVELHAFNSTDFEGEFHSHPYDAYRFVLSGGYIEEVVPDACSYIVRDDGIKEITCETQRAVFYEGEHGPVKWSHRHRIDELIPPIHSEQIAEGEPLPLVFTLWIHGARTHETELFVVANLMQPPQITL